MVSVEPFGHWIVLFTALPLNCRICWVALSTNPVGFVKRL
jgi:hypothetical protein